MGDIADGILNGDFDEYTGEYIGPGQGFPRSLSYHAGGNKNIKRLGQRSDMSKEVYGIANFLFMMGIKNWQNTILKYNREERNNEIETSNNNRIATMIQSDFGKFRSWALKNKEELKKL